MHFLLVGHCGPDSFLLKQAVERAVPGASVVMVNERDALERRLAGSVLLVNRVLDGDFGTGSGIELIRELSDGDDPPPMMLISNHADAQTQAEAAGARPGFGKADVFREETVRKLREAAGGSSELD